MNAGKICHAVVEQIKTFRHTQPLSLLSSILTFFLLHALLALCELCTLFHIRFDGVPTTKFFLYRLIWLYATITFWIFVNSLVKKELRVLRVVASVNNTKPPLYIRTLLSWSPVSSWNCWQILQNGRELQTTDRRSKNAWSTLIQTGNILRDLFTDQTDLCLPAQQILETLLSKYCFSVSNLQAGELAVEF